MMELNYILIILINYLMRNNLKTIFINGCFDILHPGHFDEDSHRILKGD